jgi:hypothetical protein
MKIPNQKAGQKITPTRNVFAAILAILLLSSGAHVTAIGSVSPGNQVDAFDRLLSEEEKGNFNDALKTAQDSSTQAQGYFQTFLDKWKWLNDNYASLPLSVQDAFNKLNNAGIKNKVSSAKDFLGQFNSGIDKFNKGKAKVDSALNFLDHYAPDKSNPFRSLEVLKNLLDDAENLLPADDKLQDPASKTIVWLIKTGIDYFRTGITGAYSGIKNIQKLIKDRAGNCIGYVGGDATEDSSDPRRKAFTDMKTGDIICYTGIRPVGGEVWSNMEGNGVYIWFSGRWTKFSAGLGVVQDVFGMYRLAHGRAVTAEMIIELINNGLSNIQRSKTKATENYRKLFERITKCQIDILELIDSEDDRAQLLQESSNSKKEFIAKYVFSVGTIREMSNVLVNVIDNYSMVSGYVVDKDGDAVANASFTFTAGQAKGVATSDNTGYFKTLVDAAVTGSSSLAATVTVTHPSYADFSETTRLYQQCQSVGQLKLEDKEAEITQLIITPALPKIKVDETVTFKVLAKDSEGRFTDVTSLALPSSKSFTGTAPGTFSVTATHAGKSTTAIITVEKDETELEEAIEDMKEDEEEDICSLEYIQDLWGELNEVVTDARQINRRFISLHSKFNKEINDQMSPPCKNGILAYCYNGAVEAASQLDNLMIRVRELSTEIIMLRGICIDLGAEMDAAGITIGNLVGAIAGLGAYKSRLSDMQARLNENGCDENELRQLGETIIPPDEDPDFIQDGGIMQEVPGDAVDNDANGIIDEAFTGLSGFNVTFFIYDSGPAKDDAFDVSVSAYGYLMSSQAGGKQAAGLNLDPGIYTATVFVRSAPDDVGTFTLNIFENGVRIQSVSGSPGEGAAVPVSFTVKGNKRPKE